MSCSEAQRLALARARAVKAERKAALKAANAQMVEMVKSLGLEHLGETYIPPSELSAALAHLSESRGN